MHCQDSNWYCRLCAFGATVPTVGRSSDNLGGSIGPSDRGPQYAQDRHGDAQFHLDSRGLLGLRFCGPLRVHRLLRIRRKYEA